MIEVKYGLLPKENFCRYFEFLINKTYKILPLKEEKSDTLKSYLESYQRELIGNMGQSVDRHAFHIRHLWTLLLYPMAMYRTL